MDEDAIVAAVRAAEARTSGQIVCVLAQRSSEINGETTIFAAALALLTPWPLLAFTQIAGAAYFRHPGRGFRRRACCYLPWTHARAGALMPRFLKRRQAFPVALEQFFIRGMTRTRHRAGVLIFVSLAEHYARIIADDGLTAGSPKPNGARRLRK